MQNKKKIINFQFEPVNNFKKAEEVEINQRIGKINKILYELSQNFLKRKVIQKNKEHSCMEVLSIKSTNKIPKKNKKCYANEWNEI